uniref:protein arginine N-methyltransferase 5 isoform X2 n=1 Tax=Myxine glutinosa TaxID=7769 RepID=UPI00358FBAD8
MSKEHKWGGLFIDFLGANVLRRKRIGTPCSRYQPALMATAGTNLQKNKCVHANPDVVSRSSDLPVARSVDHLNLLILPAIPAHHSPFVFDFVCAPIVHPRYKREFLMGPAKNRSGPLTRSDLLMPSTDWSTLIVGKISPWLRLHSDLDFVRRNSEAAFMEELRFAAYLSLPALLISLHQADNSNLARCLMYHMHSSHHGQAFWIHMPMVSSSTSCDDVIDGDSQGLVGIDCNEDTWLWWHCFRCLCDYNKRISLALEITADLPSEDEVGKWLGEPIKAAMLPTGIFLTNKKGFPVLSRAHQQLVFRLFKLDVQFVVKGTNRHSDKELRTYQQYLEHLFHNRPASSSYDLYSKGYEDYLQCPLQPLMDNLESQTYEVFEKDPVKYSQYQLAIYRVLLDKVPEEEKDTKILVVMVLGAGRGPLVNATLRAAQQASRKVRVYAVEKNPNTVVTLLNWKEEEWGNQVHVISSDMRRWNAPELADVLISELLGSFGDNELSPECLDGVTQFLHKDGVSIPSSYTSYLTPISSSKLYNEVRACREKDRDPEAQFEMPYVVRLHNYSELAEPQPCFSFTHPNRDETHDNGRYKVLNFTSTMDGVLHGFAGYFETELYAGVTLSIHPTRHSPGMFSWFPILFPIKHPIPVHRGDPVCVCFWRCFTSQKVWYEWAVTSPSTTAMHNPAGRSYTIGL